MIERYPYTTKTYRPAYRLKDLIGVAVLFVLSTTAFLNYGELYRDNVFVILTFLINGFIFLFQLSTVSPIGYSLREIYYIFMFMFMFLAPLLQYLVDKFPWSNTELLTDQRIIYANLLILVFTLLFEIVYRITNCKIGTISTFLLGTVPNADFFVKLSMFCSTAYLIFLLSGEGTLLSLFSRATYGQAATSDISSPVSLILNISVAAFSVLGFSFALQLRKVKKISTALLLLALALFLVLNFPTGRARYWIGTVYIGVFLTSKVVFRRKHAFKLAFLIAFIVLFPFLNLLRARAINEIIGASIQMPTLLDSFYSGDFDAYSMFVRTIAYVHENGHTWGRQFLGNFLFFVPRTVWPSKPVGSGAFIAQKLGWSFTNIANPFISEGYINFGIVGSIILSIILGMVLKKLDFLYFYDIRRGSDNITLIRQTYPFLIGFLFFILRGDLLSTLSYLIGFMVPSVVYYVIFRLLRILKRTKVSPNRG